MKKIRVITIGSCTARDALRTAYSKQSDNYDLESFYLGSIFAGVVPPGEIATELSLWQRSHPASLSVNFRQQVDRILKYPNLNLLVNSITPFDVVVLDWGYELTKQYITENEQFDVILDFYKEAKSYFPPSICDKVLCNTVKFDLVDQATVMTRHRRLVDFFKLLKTKTRRIVCLGNVATDLEWCYQINGIVKNLSAFESKLPFFTVNESYKETSLNSSYYFEVVSRFYSQVQHIAEKEGVEWVSVDREKCIMDPLHQYGPGPSHLHFVSRVEIKSSLISAINKVLINEVGLPDKVIPLTIRKPRCAS